MAEPKMHQFEALTNLCRRTYRQANTDESKKLINQFRRLLHRQQAA